MHGDNAVHIQKLKKAALQPKVEAVEALHPSWQAKKLQKQKEGVAKFEGKKIIFS